MADPVQLPQSTFHSVDEFKFELSLISRRSRFRAGTRYKRRGVDVQGHCANYVETEQVGTNPYIGTCSLFFYI